MLNSVGGLKLLHFTILPPYTIDVVSSSDMWRIPPVIGDTGRSFPIRTGSQGATRRKCESVAGPERPCSDDSLRAANLDVRGARFVEWQ